MSNTRIDHIHFKIRRTISEPLTPTPINNHTLTTVFKNPNQDDTKILLGDYHPKAFKPALLRSISDVSMFSVDVVKSKPAPETTPAPSLNGKSSL